MTFVPRGSQPMHPSCLSRPVEHVTPGDLVRYLNAGITGFAGTDSGPGEEAQ